MTGIKRKLNDTHQVGIVPLEPELYNMLSTPNREDKAENSSYDDVDVADEKAYKGKDAICHNNVLQTCDLTNLEQITLPNVLDCLIQRFLHGEFYTFAGSVLISLNPCSQPNDSSGSVTNTPFKSRLSHLFSTENQNSIQIGNGMRNSIEKISTKPHVYSVGGRCIDNLRRNGNDQVVVVSGDTGAGKTTATQQLLCYFIHNNQQNEESTVFCSSNSLQKKIYCATLILESFGNASTVANPNSSRFGRFLHLKYSFFNHPSDLVHGPGPGTEQGESQNAGTDRSTSILGAQIQTCLLEKHRVSKCQPNERNFHIFYYALVGLKKGLLNKLTKANKLDTGSGTDNADTKNKLNWNQLEIGNTRDGKTESKVNSEKASIIPSYFPKKLDNTDEKGLTNFLQSMETLNFSSVEIESVLEIIYGLMILLNLIFVPTRGTSKNRSSISVHEEDESEDKENENNDLPFMSSKKTSYFCLRSGNKSKTKTSHKNKADLNQVASAIESIFGVDFERVEETMVARNFCAGRRKSSVRKPCETSKECEERLSALTTTVYDALFHFILQRLNILLSESRDESPNDDDDTSDLNRDRDRDHDHDGKPEYNKISLLDLYGFEKLTGQNHFEQLCINYANERLHQVHILHAKSHFQEVESWMDVDVDSPAGASTGTGCVSTSFGSGRKSINVFESLGREMCSRLSVIHSRLFTTLNEACVLNRNQSDEQVYSRLATTTSQMTRGRDTGGTDEDDLIRCGKLFESKCEFVVKHYAADVCYSLKGMVDKNRDYVPSELLDLLQCSSNELIGRIMSSYRDRDRNNSTRSTVISNLKPQEKASGTGTGTKVKRMGFGHGLQKKEKKTVLDRFKSSVDGLVNELDPVINAHCQDVHFIRCIRPNNQLLQGQIDRKLVEQQLFSTGIVDFIRITQNGYPIRMPKRKFLLTFGSTIKRSFSDCDIVPVIGCDGNSIGAEMDCLSDLLNLGGSNKVAGIRLGKDQVFMREETWTFFTKLKVFVLARAVKIVQRSWRKYQLKLKEEAERKEFLESEARKKAHAEEIEALKTYTCDRTLEWLHEVHNASLTELETSFLKSLHNLEKIQRSNAKMEKAEDVSFVGPSPSAGPHGDSPQPQPQSVILSRFNLILGSKLKNKVKPKSSDGNGGDGRKEESEGGMVAKLNDGDRNRNGRNRCWLELQKWCDEAGLFVTEDKSIVSRRMLLQGRMRFYVRKTALANSHIIPRRLMPQGLMDIFDSFPLQIPPVLQPRKFSVLSVGEKLDLWNGSDALELESEVRSSIDHMEEE